MPQCLIFTARQSIEMKQSIKYSLEYVLCSCTLFFHIVCLSFDTKLQALNKFFKPVTVELFRLFLKPFSHSSLDFCFTCELNSFEMFHKCYRQPEIRQYQFWALRRVWNNLNSDVLFTTVVATLVWGLALLCWRSIGSPPPSDLHNWYVVSTSLGLHICHGVSFLQNIGQNVGCSGHMLQWLAFYTMAGCSGSNFHHCPLIFSPNDAQCSCPQYLLHKKSIVTVKFLWEFHFHVSKTENLHAVWGKC